MQYKDIIFDIDGTLIDTEYAVLHSLAKTIYELTSKEINHDDLKFALGIPGKNALEQLKVKDIEKASERWSIHMKSYYYTVKPFEGIVECLDKLRKQGIRLGVITSKTKAEYQTEFVPFGLDKYFSIVICADDTAKHKPNPEPLLAYLEKANIKKEEAIYIGDSIYDMQCAQSAGVANGVALWGCATAIPFQTNYRFVSPKEVCKQLL